MKNDSPVLRITRGGETLYGPMPGNDWTVFAPNHSTYEPLITGNSKYFKLVTRKS